MRTLEQHEMDQVSGAGLFTDAGVVLDNSAMRIGALLLGFTRPIGTNTVADEIGKVVESTVKSLTSLFGSVLKRK